MSKIGLSTLFCGLALTTFALVGCEDKKETPAADSAKSADAKPAAEAEKKEEEKKEGDTAEAKDEGKEEEKKEEDKGEGDEDVDDLADEF